MDTDAIIACCDVTAIRAKDGGYETSLLAREQLAALVANQIKGRCSDCRNYTAYFPVDFDKNGECSYFAQEFDCEVCGNDYCSRFTNREES